MFLIFFEVKETFFIPELNQMASQVDWCYFEHDLESAVGIKPPGNPIPSKSMF